MSIRLLCQCRVAAKFTAWFDAVGVTIQVRVRFCLGTIIKREEYFFFFFIRF